MKKYIHANILESIGNFKDEDKVGKDYYLLLARERSNVIV